MESLSRSDLIKAIERYQCCIQRVNPPESDAQRVLHYIRKLSKLPIKLGELEKTGVGKTINALRKCQGTLGEEASLLVGKWKAIAKKEVQEAEEEEESESHKRSDADSHSDYESPDGEYKSSVGKSSKKNRVDVEKVQAEKSIKEIKLKPSKDKVQHSNDRKRKYSEKDKHERKEKYVKLEPTSQSEDENCLDETRASKETTRKSIKVDDKHRNSDKKKRKDKPDDDNVVKKEHDKKHHKSSKHKEDKNHHRHHSGSKSSHTEKKRDSKSDSEKHRERSDKKKESSKGVYYDSNVQFSDGSRRNSKSSSKYSSNGPSAGRMNDSDSEDYDNSPVNHTDDDFGAALLGISQAVSPVKKKSTPSKYSSSIQSSPATNSPLNSGSELDMLSSTVKLEPLDDMDFQVDKFKEDTYKSKDDYVKERSSLRLKEISEEEALNSMITTKNQRTKVFSGCKSRVSVKLPSLFELCVRVLQDNFDGLEYTGGVPYDVLKPILEKVTVEQLYTFENYNPYLIGETDELWEYHAKRHFRSAKRQELETWRDVYLRCVEEREEKLQSLTENITQSIANSTPVRKTKLAYCDTHVKPPRNVARSQAKHGTGHISVKRSPKGPQPSAAAVQSVKERLAQESLGAPQAVTLASRNQIMKKKKAPLMQKSLQLLKGLKR